MRGENRLRKRLEMIIYLLEYVVTELPSFGKEGCPPGGVVGKEYFDLFYIGVAKAVYFSYHLPLRVLLFRKEES